MVDDLALVDIAIVQPSNRGGWVATPSLLNTEDNEKSFANVSEVAGNSRIKM